MWPKLIIHNTNNADAMPCGPTCVMNAYDIMQGVYDICMLVSRASLHNIDMSHFICWPDMHVC